MSAPAAASRRSWAIAASSPKWRPPSVNESGVTFTIPITRVRSSSHSTSRARRIIGLSPIAFAIPRAPIQGWAFMGKDSSYARHAGPLPPLRRPRVRGEGEGAALRGGPPAGEAEGPHRGRPRLLHQRGKGGRIGHRGDRGGGGPEHRRGRRPGEGDAGRDLPVRPPELLPRRLGPREDDLRPPGGAAPEERLPGPLLPVRILQIVQGEREGPPAL